MSKISCSFCIPIIFPAAYVLQKYENVMKLACLFPPTTPSLDAILCLTAPDTMSGAVHGTPTILGNFTPVPSLAINYDYVKISMCLIPVSHLILLEPRKGENDKLGSSLRSISQSLSSMTWGL